MISHKDDITQMISHIEMISYIDDITEMISH